MGTVGDTRMLTLGGEEQKVTMRVGQQRVDLDVPADAVPRRTPVTVRLETDVPKRGPTPAGGVALHVATQAVTLSPPARMRQPVAPPPTGRQYVAVTAQPNDQDWAQRAPARAAEMDGDQQVYEIDVQGTGLWGIALVSAPAQAQDGGASDAGAGDRPPPPPAPQLAQMAPVAGTAGTAAQLTLTGSGFADDAAVVFDGQRIATTRGSATTLTAQVPAAATAQAGQHGVWIENGPPGVSSRSNVLYFTVNAAMGAPVIVDYSPDNGLPGDKVLIVGSSLVGPNLKISDAAGTTATAGMEGTTQWWGGTQQTLEVTIPAGWQTGPITIAHDKGSYRGKIFNVGRNLGSLDATMRTASSEYGGTWTIARGADNLLVTSWFSKNGDCATQTGCTSVPWYTLTFATPQTIARVAMRGNREYMSGYDFLRGRFELLGAGDAVLWSATYDLPEPDRDLDIVLPVPLAGVSAVKFTSEKDESIEPGFAELEAFGP